MFSVMKCQALDLVETDFNMEIAHKFQISGQDLHPARIAPFLLTDNQSPLNWDENLVENLSER